VDSFKPRRQIAE